MAGKFVKSNKPAIIFSIIRNYIADGTWKPGDKFSSFEVAKMLGVGRSSVNEAIKLLEGKGFVYILPNVGFSIRCINPKELKAFFEIRKALMQVAGRYLIIPEKRETLIKLQSNMKLIQATYNVQEYTASITGIEEYYLELFAVLDITYLVVQLKETIDFYYYCLIRIKNSFPEMLGEIIILEQGYLDALISGDQKQVETALRNQHQTFKNVIAKLFKET